mgnify:CR=1 FL=1
MAKIIKVGSQNPTFTSQKIKKASPLHTHRNSNEATNPTDLQTLLILQRLP